MFEKICTDESFAYLCDGVDSFPALAEHFWVGVVHESHEAGQQCACVNAVVQSCSREVAVEDGDGRLPQPRVCSSRGLQEIINDDSLADFILHREDHSLTVAQLLSKAIKDTFTPSTYSDSSSFPFQ